MKKTAATQLTDKTAEIKASSETPSGKGPVGKLPAKLKRASEKTISATAAAEITPVKRRSTSQPALENGAAVTKKLLKPGRGTVKAVDSAAAPAPAKSAKPVEPAASAEPKAKTKVDASTVVRRTYPRRKPYEPSEPLHIPSILLEGDDLPPVSVNGPGEKYSLGATPPTQSFSGGELPESYGTKKLFLTARDPHWLYAHWDLTREQQNEFNALSTDGHLVLRIFAGKIEGHPAYEIHVHPESRHWFAHVERAGNSYSAELGYYSALGKWMRVAVSSGTVTPPDAEATEGEAEFATIPFEFPFVKLMQIIEEAVQENLPLAHAIEELRRHGHPELPRFSSSGLSSIAPFPSSTHGSSRTWTPEQERALAKIISIDETRRVWMGSLEITELIRRRLAHDATSPVAGFTSPASLSLAGLTGASSPTGGVSAPPEKGKGFWFNVNAELIIYGATEPNARVTLGGHDIKLRPDGTFSFRFALPDGKYDLPAVAISQDGTDGRAAELKFSRQTEYLGDVGVTPQDPALQPPLPENI